MVDSAAAQAIVEWLDDHPAPAPAAARIAFGILSLVGPSDPVISDAMRHYQGADDGAVDVDAVRGKIAQVMSDPIESRNSLYRLGFSLISDITPLDGYLAEYLFAWARDIGAPEGEVVAIMESTLSDYGYRGQSS
jgi:hypothetical protein